MIDMRERMQLVSWRSRLLAYAALGLAVAALPALLLLAPGSSTAEGWSDQGGPGPYDYTSQTFNSTNPLLPAGSNKAPSGSVAHTRHNLTQAYNTGGGAMDTARNQYNEVCVYCHTPHGSNNAETPLPLWNHTIPDKTTFTTFTSNALNGMTQTVTNPGPASLTCLSCHDGSIAIDSVINMPGSGLWRRTAGSQTAPPAGGIGSGQVAFLNSWSTAGGVGPPPGNHQALGSSTFGGAGCVGCHSPGGIFGPGFPDFRVFNLGKDLTDDHPVGVTYPAALGPADGFKQPTHTTPKGNIKFFEVYGGSGLPSPVANGKLNTSEIRLYDSGDGFEVECASCHDPHGVPYDGSVPFSGSYNTPGLARTGSAFSPSFLRIMNTGSDVCLTCHDK